MPDPVPQTFATSSDPAHSKLLDQCASLVGNVVNIGSHVLVWCNESGDRNELKVPAMLLRHLIEQLDGVAVMVRQGAFDPCRLQLRSCLEVLLFIKYITQDETIERGNAYQLQHYYAMRSLCLRADPNQEQGKQFRATLRKDAVLAGLANDGRDTSDFVEQLNSKITQEPYEHLDAEWTKIKSERNGAVHWYSLFGGPRSIAGLAEHLGMYAWYEIVYRHWSADVHPSGTLSALEPAADGVVTIRMLRSLDCFQEITVWACHLAMTTMEMIVGQYMTNEQQVVFEDWFASEIKPERDALMAINLTIRLPDDD